LISGRCILKFILRRTGGQGLRFEGELDTADLPEALAQRVEEFLTVENLSEAVQIPENALMVDALLYELILIPDGFDEDALEQETAEQDFQTFEFSEAQDIPEVLDILDELMGEIIRRKLESRKENREDKTGE